MIPPFESAPKNLVFVSFWKQVHKSFAWPNALEGLSGTFCFLEALRQKFQRSQKYQNVKVAYQCRRN